MDTQLERALDQARQQLPAEEQLLFAHFAELYFPAIPKRYRTFLEGADLAEFLIARWEFFKPPIFGCANIRVSSPGEGRKGWDTNFSVVEARLDDRPFIVDSLKEHLRQRGLEIHLTVHPVLVVGRGTDGRVQALATSRARGQREAFVYMQCDRIATQRERETIEKALTDILRMVCTSVDDYANMQATAREVANDLVEHPEYYPGVKSTNEQKRDFFTWLLDGNFTFLACRRLERAGDAFVPVADSVFGLFRADRTPQSFLSSLERELARYFETALARDYTMSVARIGVFSPVHRIEEMDYISIRRRSDDSRVYQVVEIVGLFTTSALYEKPHRIPLIRDKMAEVLNRLGYLENSYSHKTAVSILNSLPKEFLFNSSSEDLQEEVDTLLSAEDGDEILVSLRAKPDQARLTATVRMPETSYNTAVRDRILEKLRTTLTPAVMRDYHCAAEGEVCRLHVYLFNPKLPEDSQKLWELEAALQETVRTWQERLVSAVEAMEPGPDGKELAHLYAAAFPEVYRSSNNIDSAIWDIQHLEELIKGSPVHVGIYRYTPDEKNRSEITEVRVFSRIQVLLSQMMPILSNAGLMVVEERATEVALGPRGSGVIHSFQVLDSSGQPIPADRMRPLSESLLMVLLGNAESDPLDGLVLAAGADWRGAELLITYRNLMMQVARTSSVSAVNEALLKYSGASRALLGLFEARFDPDLTGDRAEAVAAARAEFGRFLDKVDSISADRALRTLHQLVEATVRTNFYAVKPPGEGCISVKIVSGRVPSMPDPKPLFEIYVHGPGVEAVHLRGGKVARGGIRWSDRPDDFRTEILGLMKTQMVKNSVIVPVGSKGGFVLKRSAPNRKALGEEMVRQYTVFMRGLLDITDNIVLGKTIHPERVVCHDDPDPYLVVAADKGTAQMSDTANSISKSYGFWLGDAFASGGSAGYSHKAMAITARGAWECVKRHFLELGVDVATTSISAVGIGDMSGDVFGNGMLLSPRMRLLAAFDHRHIFLDPSPDPRSSFEERQRLFNLPVSSWADYRTDLISGGGGVFNRGEKKILLSPQVRAMLGIETESVNGEELIRAILKARCDLLWNGGIGTYIKSAEESHTDVGDKTNDEVRVDAREVRARVIGEGGNLGITQRARLEYVRNGGRINTDAIDNSGGVDCSDHEVNLKILFQLLLEEKKIAGDDERDRVLRDLTDQIANLVLRNNYLQSALLSMDELRSQTDVEPFLVLIDSLVKRSLVDRDKDHIPSDEELRAGMRAGRAIPRPVLALVTGWAKKVLFDMILGSGIPDRDYYRKYFIEYFPPSIWETYGEACLGHFLRREIIATTLANRVLNQAGITFFIRLMADSGDELPEVVRIYILVNDLLEGDRIREAIHALDGRAPAAWQYKELLVLEETIYSICRRILRSKLQQEITGDVVARYAPEVRQVKLKLREHMSPEIRARLASEEESITAQGFPPELAQEMASMRYLKPVLTMVRIREQSRTSLEQVVGLWYRLGDELFLHYLTQEIEKVPLKDEWDRDLCDAVSRDLARYQRKLTLLILHSRNEGETPQESLDRFLRDRKKPYSRLKSGIARLRASGTTGLVPVQVLKASFEEMLAK